MTLDFKDVLHLKLMDVNMISMIPNLTIINNLNLKSSKLIGH